MAERDYSDPYGRPTTGPGFGRGNPVVAGTEYYSDLENALKLLASADAQRSTTNSTAGEAMRFYNMFRDARLRNRPTAVDTQALINAINTSPEVRLGLEPMFEGYKDYLGGMSAPLYVAGIESQNRLDKYGPVNQSNASGNVSLIPAERGNFADDWDARYTRSNYFAKVNEQNSGGSPNYDDPGRYRSLVEISPEQFEQAELARRARLPLPAQLQLMLDEYVSPNFRIANTIENVLDNAPQLVSDSLENIRFFDRDSGPFWGGNALTDFAAKLQSMPEGPGSAWASANHISLPKDTAVTDADPGWKITQLLDFAPTDGFEQTLLHELSHLVDNGTLEENNYWTSAGSFDDLPSGSKEYVSAANADAIVSQQHPRLDYDVGNDTIRTYGFEDANSGLSVSSYGRNSGKGEDFAEAMMMYLKDLDQGWIAEGENWLGVNNGEKYTFAELYPNRARYFDSLFGLNPFGSGDVGRITERTGRR